MPRHPELLVSPWAVTVDGFDEIVVYAATRGKAMSKVWRSYVVCHDCTFGDFLRLAKCHRTVAHAEFGRKITVEGRPAFNIPSDRGHYVAFVYTCETNVLYAHPRDVVEVNW